MYRVLGVIIPLSAGEGVLCGTPLRVSSVINPHRSSAGGGGARVKGFGFTARSK